MRCFGVKTEMIRRFRQNFNDRRCLGLWMLWSFTGPRFEAVLVFLGGLTRRALRGVCSIQGRDGTSEVRSVCFLSRRKRLREMKVENGLAEAKSGVVKRLNSPETFSGRKFVVDFGTRRGSGTRVNVWGSIRRSITSGVIGSGPSQDGSSHVALARENRSESLTRSFGGRR